MNESLIKQILIQDEGYRSSVYEDTLGLLTVGVGHLLPQDGSYHVGQLVGDDQISSWLKADIDRAVTVANQFVPSLGKLGDTRATVIVSLAFNMGTKLSQFHKFLAAVALQQWADAAKELQDSEWYRQVGLRGPKYCAALVNGFF